jgi:LysM repeat protein
VRHDPARSCRWSFVKESGGFRQVFVKVAGRGTDGLGVTRIKRLLLATGVTLALAAPIAAPFAAAGVEAAPASTTITVRDGDSLAGLAWRHGVSLSSLLQANSLSIASVIHPGDTLVLPGATPSPAAPRPSTGATVTPTTAAGTTTITVRAGDSLAGLAWRHRVSLSALLQANSLAITSIIHPGRTLVLPGGGVASRSIAPSVTTNSSSGRSAYVVRAGDALAGIAWRHGVTLSALVAANGLTVSSVIHPGRSLTIPPATRHLPSVRTTSTPSTPAAAGSRSSSTAVGSSIEKLTTFLRAQVGLPYRFFSAGPDSYDCSGLVVAAFRQVGVSLPHQSRALATRGTAVDWSTESIAAGDLVFTSAFDDPDRITHVGIALDSRRWIQAIGPGRDVSIGFLPSSARIMEVRRIDLP